ncbi:hypothetical protein EZI54_22380 [Marinobacter halodurans]|uniref:Uncharacterized protein n=1 Tax=Marinobacter halodurans TaxID=2528979 RepID=A0ABY1ZDZ2_9GAMM|nr:hypothetical protein [Marinobacter halodurans]TBW47619.1 hypothetical protein EZI54_22380 [Marinobacter halodurans]
MNYKIKMRQINKNDIRPECPNIPKTEEYEMYLNAFVKDISSISVVINAERSANEINVVTDNCSIEEFREHILPFIQGIRATQYRVESIAQLV